MTVPSILRALAPGLLPLALAACINAGPAIAEPSASASIGVDLGGAPARASEPAMRVAAMPASMPGMNHTAKPDRAGEVQMVHDGHAGAHGTGTVNAVNVAQRKIGMKHEPIPALGWPAMTMEFAVAPSVNLQAIQPGSRVDFMLEKGADGMYVIQSVQPAGGGR